MIDWLLRRLEAWFGMPADVRRRALVEQHRGASRDRTLPGKARRAARRRINTQS